MLLLGPSYYDQYPVFLAPATSVLAGAAAELMLRMRFPVVRAGVKTVAFGIPVLITAWFLNGERKRQPISDFGAVVRETVPLGACLYADPPVLALAAGRLSDSPGPADPLIDPFGELIYLAYESGGEFRSISTALMADAAQTRMRQVLKDCEFVALSGRLESKYRWSRETQAQLRADFESIVASQDGRSTLWRKRRALDSVR